MHCYSSLPLCPALRLSSTLAPRPIQTKVGLLPADVMRGILISDVSAGPSSATVVVAFGHLFIIHTSIETCKLIPQVICSVGRGRYSMRDISSAGVADLSVIFLHTCSLFVVYHFALMCCHTIVRCMILNMTRVDFCNCFASNYMCFDTWSVCMPFCTCLDTCQATLYVGRFHFHGEIEV